MFRLSKLADYATVMMAYMTIKFNELHNARDISAQTHIALPTVSKILKIMVNAGLLVSTRGAKGGYCLARSPANISVAEVLAAIDGEFGMTNCSHELTGCEIEPYCSISCNWQLISQTMLNALQTLSLEQMAKPMQARHIPVSQEIFVDAIIGKTAGKTRGVSNEQSD